MQLWFLDLQKLVPGQRTLDHHRAFGHFRKQKRLIFNQHPECQITWWAKPGFPLLIYIPRWTDCVYSWSNFSWLFAQPTHRWSISYPFRSSIKHWIPVKSWYFSSAFLCLIFGIIQRCILGRCFESQSHLGRLIQKNCSIILHYFCLTPIPSTLPRSLW